MPLGNDKEMLRKQLIAVKRSSGFGSGKSIEEFMLETLICKMEALEGKIDNLASIISELKANAQLPE